MSKGLPPPERSLLALVRMGGAAEVRLCIMDSRAALCEGFVGGAALVSITMEVMGVLRVGAVLVEVMRVLDMVDMEVEDVDEEEEEVVAIVVDVLVVGEEDAVVDEDVGVSDGERVEVNETVETNPGLFAVFAVDVAPPLLIFGHSALTPDPPLKAEMTSPPGSCTFAQAELTAEEIACSPLAHDCEHGF